MPVSSNDTSRPPMIVHVAGFGRSGSTLVESYLAARYSIASVGELTFYFERGVVADELCGCGVPFSECSFWRVVRSNEDEELAEDYRELRARLENVGEWSSYVIGKDAAEHRYRDINHKLYERIFSVIEETSLIDNSKFPLRIRRMLQIGEFRHKILHVVRNPARVAESWRKRVLRPEHNPKSYSSKQYMTTIPTTLCAVRWLLSNIQAWALCHVVGKANYIRVDYADFVREPDQIGRAIAQKFGLAARGTTAEFTHSVSGNPGRFRHDFDIIRPAKKSRRPIRAWVAAAWVYMITAPALFLVRTKHLEG